MAGHSSAAGECETIRWGNFARFVRQLSHDLRNQLNAIELQAALTNELTEDPELKPEVARLRELVAKLGTTLQQLSTTVAPPCPTCLRYSVKDLLEDLEKKIAQDFPEQANRVKWEVLSGEANLDIDPQLIGWVFRELFDNAFRYDSGGNFTLRGRGENDRFTFELREQKNEAVASEKWTDLLSVIKHGHYGLGLKRARAIVDAHGGELTSEWDSHSSTFISRMVLPCSTESN